MVREQPVVFAWEGPVSLPAMMEWGVGWAGLVYRLGTEAYLEAALGQLCPVSAGPDWRRRQWL